MLYQQQIHAGGRPGVRVTKAQSTKLVDHDKKAQKAELALRGLFPTGQISQAEDCVTSWNVHL